jgi:hypothetical protein
MAHRHAAGMADPGNRQDVSLLFIAETRVVHTIDQLEHAHVSAYLRRARAKVSHPAAAETPLLLQRFRTCVPSLSWQTIAFHRKRRKHSAFPPHPLQRRLTSGIEQMPSPGRWLPGRGLPQSDCMRVSSLRSGACTRCTQQHTTMYSTYSSISKRCQQGSVHSRMLRAFMSQQAARVADWCLQAGQSAPVPGRRCSRAFLLRTGPRIAPQCPPPP